jgi:hypothetical protein
MQIQKECLAILDEAVGVFEVGLALADGLDLSAAQGDPGLDLFKQKVIVAGSPVLGGVALSAGDRIPRPGRLLGAGFTGLGDDVTSLTGHWRNSLNLHRSIGLERAIQGMELC